MIRGYSIDLLTHLDTCTKFNIMDFIVETIERTTCENKRSCGYASYIQLLINAKVGSDVFLLDCKHEPLRPELENHIVQLDPNDTHADREAAAREANQPAIDSAIPSLSTQPPVVVPKTQTGQLSFLCTDVQRIEAGLANLAQNQDSLSRVVETKAHIINNKIDELDVEVKELRAIFM